MGVTGSSEQKITNDQATVNDEASSSTSKKDGSKKADKESPTAATSQTSSSSAASNTSTELPVDTYIKELEVLKTNFATLLTRIEKDKIALNFSDNHLQQKKAEHLSFFQNLKLTLQAIANKLKPLLKKAEHIIETPDVVIADLAQQLKQDIGAMSVERINYLTQLNTLDGTKETEQQIKSQLAALDMVLAREAEIFIQEMEVEINDCEAEDEASLALVVVGVKMAVQALTGVSIPGLNFDYVGFSKQHIGNDIQPEEPTVDALTTNVNTILLNDVQVFETQSPTAAAVALANSNKGVKLSSSRGSPIASPASSPKPTPATVADNQENRPRI